MQIMHRHLKRYNFMRYCGRDKAFKQPTVSIENNSTTNKDRKRLQERRT